MACGHIFMICLVRHHNVSEGRFCVSGALQASAVAKTAFGIESGKAVLAQGLIEDDRNGVCKI